MQEIDSMQNARRLSFLSQIKEVVADNVGVKGQIPVWLQGSLIRVGPAQFEVGNQHYNHWFDGHAMLYRFTFDNGRIHFANKFIESDSRRLAVEKGRIVVSEFGTFAPPDPSKGLLRRFMDRMKIGADASDNTIVNVARIPQTMLGEPEDVFVAMTEVPITNRFDPITLATCGHLDLRGQGANYGGNELQGQTTTAHPRFDNNGTMFNFVTSIGKDCSYRLYSRSIHDSEARLVCSIPTDRPSLIHSFGMTENFIIFAEYPFTLSALSAATTKIAGRAYVDNFVWDPSRMTKFHIVSKQQGKVVQDFTSDPMFCFHFINCFEDKDKRGVVADMCCYQDARAVTDFRLRDVSKDDFRSLPGDVRRFRFKLDNNSAATKNVAHEVLLPTSFDLPRINDGTSGGNYQYAYGVGESSPEKYIDRIMKLDTNKGTMMQWSEPNCVFSEPVFVPHPEASGEDDGVLVSLCMNGVTEKSNVVVLDARNMENLASVELPLHCPLTIHGQYFEGVGKPVSRL